MNLSGWRSDGRNINAKADQPYSRTIAFCVPRSAFCVPRSAFRVLRSAWNGFCIFSL
jgi:hypothetical protein